MLNKNVNLMRNTTSTERDEVSKAEASTLYGPLSVADAPATCMSTRTTPWGLGLLGLAAVHVCADLWSFMHETYTGRL